MNAALIGLCGALATGGLFALVLGLATEAPPARPADPSRSLSRRLRTAWRRLPASRRRVVIIACLAGIAAYVITLWAPAIVIVPALIITLPWLLADPPNHQVELLEALDRWVRALAASIATGKSIPDALRATRRQAPGPLTEPVSLLAQRLGQRWPLNEALRAFADDCDDADVDPVAAALIVASDRGGLGATATLGALADSIQDRLGAARDMETERAKPRIVVRQVTVIILAVVVIIVIISPGYFASYGHGAGPFVVIGLTAIFLGALLKLRASGAPRRGMRILTSRLAEPSAGAGHLPRERMVAP